MTQTEPAPEQDVTPSSQPEFRGKIYNNVAETVGATPLVRMSKLMEEEGLKAEVLTKLEYFNPISSVKDRIGKEIIETAEREGKITPGKTVLIEPTSGNTGIALAFIAAAKGYKLILTMPESMSHERRQMLKFLGAELVLTDAAEGMRGAIAKAKELLEENPDSFYPNQFENPANRPYTEKLRQRKSGTIQKGRSTFWYRGVGTGGTITASHRS